jgi:hypothetical protein
MPLIVGFSGHSGVGKDTSNLLLKQILASRSISHGSAAIAAKVKTTAYSLYSHLGHEHPSYYDSHREERYIKLPLIDKTPVEIWCALGDAMRDCVYTNTWVDQALYAAEESNADIFCLTDVRYPSEIEAIRRAGGVVVNVINPNAKPLPSKADHALDNWDGTYDYDLVNDSTTTELENRVDRLSKQLMRRRQRSFASAS